MSIHDEFKVDCHNHIFDPQRFPYAEDAVYRPQGQEIGTLAQMEQVFEAHGVRNALLVGPTSGYGVDNRCLLDALERHGGRWKGIAVVGNQVTRAQLETLKAGGIVGVAVNVAMEGVAAFSAADELFATLAELDLFAQIQVEKAQLLGLMPLIGRSRTRLLIDHCGRPDVAAGIDQPGFQALLGLAGQDRVFVKLSGLAKFSAQRHPYVDTHPYVHALLESFGPQACLWGSDWPFLRAPERLDYGPLLQLMELLIPDPGMRREVFWETPRRLFGFSD